MVEIMGIGVLIEGQAGIGKSETALALIRTGAQPGVGRHDGPAPGQRRGVQASAVEVTRYHMEIRGLGIIHVPSLFGVASVRREKRLDVIVKLHRPTRRSRTIAPGLPAVTRVLGVKIPVITLPVTPGRDLAHLVEVAALDYKLKRLGHDAAKELDDRLMTRLVSRPPIP